MKFTAPGTELVEDIGSLTSKTYLETTVVPLQSPNEFYKFFILLKLYYIQLYRDWVSEQIQNFV